MEEIELSSKSSSKQMMALLTAVIFLLAAIPGYFYFLHPEPINIPTLEDAQNILTDETYVDFTSHESEAILVVLQSSQVNLKRVANLIASKSCKKVDRVCQSKAIFYFVRDAIQYVPDDRYHDQLEHPITVLRTGGADCEDMSVLLVGLQKAIGNEARLVFVPGHVYTQIKIPDYKGGKWVNLEATCDQCGFGELPTDTGLQKKDYVEMIY